MDCQRFSSFWLKFRRKGRAGTISNIAVSQTIHTVFAELRAADPKWRVEIGVPKESLDHSSGWIRGVDFANSASGPFQELLWRLAARLKTNDRMTVAASFALRFGWLGSMAIVPYVVHGCVRIGLENISFRFRENTLHEETVIHDATGYAVGAGLRDQLRRELEQQQDPLWKRYTNGPASRVSALGA